MAAQRGSGPPVESQHGGKMAEPITVLVADDHAGVRSALTSLLDLSADLSVIGVASDGAEAVMRVEELRPDVAVLDVVMPQMDGLEAARRICAQCWGTRVVILSMHVTAEYVQQALEAGASGYIAKDSAGSEIVDAVRAVHRGERYLSPRVSYVHVSA